MATAAGAIAGCAQRPRSLKLKMSLPLATLDSAPVPPLLLLLPLLACCLPCAVALKVARHWPTTLNMGPPPLPLPTRQWRLPAEAADWLTEQSKWRRAERARSWAHGRDVRQKFVDEDEGALWMNISDLRGKYDRDEAFWEAVCKATNGTNYTANLSATPLDGWDVFANSTCGDDDLLEGTFTAERAAYESCGAECASVVDLGCERQNFRLCKLGGLNVASANGTCIRNRYPDHRTFEGKPQLPQEHEMWSAFCAGGDVKFRRLWPERRCLDSAAAMVDLTGALSDLMCAELTAGNALCSDVFDFTEGSPLVCRCVPKGSTCQAVAAVDASGAELFANVFIRVHDGESAASR